MKIKFIALIACFLACTNIFSQDFNNYTPLRSTGKIPDVLTRSYTDVVNADLAKLSKYDIDLYQKTQFTTYTRLIISRLVMSGQLLINDSLGNYVNKVADRLLSHDPGLRKQLNIFVVKSSAVNAYTLDNGIIMVNVGLLAQLESEAELAYILAHEISHFTEQHSMKEYVAASANNTTGITSEKYLLGNLSFSRENELSADKMGLELLIKSNYDTKAAVSALDVLKYSYLPFDEEPFDNSFLESGDIKFTREFLLTEIKQISDNEDYNDDKSTHPNIKRRRETISETLGSTIDSATDRKLYIVLDRESFKHLRTIARFETARLYLVSQDYPEAIYASYLLQKEYPNSYYLEKITAKALYNIAVYKTSTYSDKKNKDDFSIPEYSYIEGEIQQLYFLLTSLKSKEIFSVALSYCWQLRKENPQDREMHKICEDLFYLYAKHPLRNKTDLKQREVKPDSLQQPEYKTIELSKYDKIKMQQSKANAQGIASREDVFMYAFASLLSKDFEFKMLYDKYFNGGPKIKPFAYEVTPGLNGHDTLTVLDPLFVKYEHKVGLFGPHYEVKYDHSDFDSLQKEYRSIMEECGRQHQVSFRYFDPTDFDSLDIEVYNDISLLGEWQVENSRHTRPLALNSMDEYTSNLEGKYGRFLMWNIAITERRKIKYLGGLIAFSAVFYPIGIFTFPAMLFHKRYLHSNHTLILDLRNNKIIQSEEESTLTNSKYDWFRESLDKTFEQFKTTRKRENKNK